MQQRGATTLTRYSVAVASICVATLLRLALEPVLGSRFPFATLFFAVLVTAWFGGFGPALVASVLGSVASVWFLLSPRYDLELTRQEAQAGLLLYAVVSLGIALIGGAMRRAQGLAQATAGELETQREQLRVTLDSIGDAVITTDTNGIVTSINRVAAALTGWSTAEAIGQPLERVFRIVNEETGLPVENPVHKVLASRGIVGLAIHTVLVGRDGVRRLIDDSAAPILDSGGAVIGTVLVFRDVTESQHARQAQAFLAAVVTSSEDAIVTKTLDGVITSWNPGAERLFGYRAEEVIGQPITVIIPPERHHEETEIIGRLRNGERIDHFETVRVTKDGKPVDISLALSPVRDASGRIIGASKVARDITERKRAEEALRASDRSKDIFLATLAHELRNPLAPLRNSIEIMKRANGDPRLLATVQVTMDRQVSHLQRLVDDLLDIARISRDQIELRQGRVELASVLHHAVETCRPLTESRKLDLNVDVPPEPIYLEADPVRLAQVFSNLLNNACKYTAIGGHISVTSHREGSNVIVSVRDTGIGIPPEMLSNVFDMFAQLRHTETQLPSGLGIGLTLARRLVEMHGGTIEAHSKGLGHGSEFVVRLPALPDTTLPVSGLPVTAETSSPRQRILVIDDNVDAAESLAMLLQMNGHEVHLAYDGVVGFAAAESFRPDVVLLDIGLPKMNGYDVARRIRAEKWGKDMVLVALTGWGQEEDRRKSRDVGFNHHMVKPVDPDTLMQLLANREGGPTSPAKEGGGHA